MQRYDRTNITISILNYSGIFAEAPSLIKRYDDHRAPSRPCPAAHEDVLEPGEVKKQGVEGGRMSRRGELIGSLPTPPLKSGYWNVIRNASSLRTLPHFTSLPSSFPLALSSFLSPFSSPSPFISCVSSFIIIHFSFPVILSSPGEKMIMCWKYEYKLYLPLTRFPFFIERKDDKIWLNIYWQKRKLHKMGDRIFANKWKKNRGKDKKEREITVNSRLYNRKPPVWAPLPEYVRPWVQSTTYCHFSFAIRC